MSIVNRAGYKCERLHLNANAGKLIKCKCKCIWFQLHLNASANAFAFRPTLIILVYCLSQQMLFIMKCLNIENILHIYLVYVLINKISSVENQHCTHLF